MKLNNPKTISKIYCSILKTFYSGRKIPVIPPLWKDGKRESDFKIKANYFNKYFVSQSTPLVNNSKQPKQLLITLQLDLLQLILTIMTFLKLLGL